MCLCKPKLSLPNSSLTPLSLSKLSLLKHSPTKPSFRSKLSLAAVALLFATTLVQSGYAQRVQFTALPSSVDGANPQLSARESQRIERFLGHVFPVRLMRRFAHADDKPVSRRVSYSVVEQQGKRFVIAGYTARWKEAINLLAIYRLEAGGPNQVWRSRPWEATYFGLTFRTAHAGPRTLVLFQEDLAEWLGGNIRSSRFALASVFSFQNAKRGLIIHDLTPSLPDLRAYTRFPFHPLYGQSIALENDPGQSGSSASGAAASGLVLRASDESYELSSTEEIRPTTVWRYNRQRNRFERMPSMSATHEALK